MDGMYASFPKKLERLLERKKVNMKQVAEETGIGVTTLFEWKSGKYFPTIKNLEKLANYFGVSVNYFLKED